MIVDIASRALTEPFTYAVDDAAVNEIEIGSTVLVEFGRRLAVGYVIAIAEQPQGLPDGGAVEGRSVKTIRSVLARRSFSAISADIARWMAREYVASTSECLRLFLPPGRSARLSRAADGTYVLEQPRVSEVCDRWVSLTERGRRFEPPARASRQRQLIQALSCGPVTTRELAALYTSMSATVRALERRGLVSVEQRRVWRGCDQETTLSSASGLAPETLTGAQVAALKAIGRAVSAGRGDVVLIDGVTGSGKTEVYLSAIEPVLEAGRSACVLVPEISLTAQTVGRFRSRFGATVAVFHSRLSAGERLDQWDRVRDGTARVVVGARSALFCPFSDLGIIIIDEEHEQSYKQGSNPRYHAREVAAAMAARYGCALVLGSATPSAESLMRCREKGYANRSWLRVTMPDRPGFAQLPNITIADLRREFRSGGRSIFSRPLAAALERVAERGEKAVLLHNRRGFAPFLMCRECGCVPTCRHCSTALTYHERTHTLECHTCSTVYRIRAYPDQNARCPRCNSPYLAKMGLGTQQVEDALHALLPCDVEIIRMDADSTRGRDGHKRLLERFDAARCSVLLGTQMIAKGLDFPEVTLAGVINADYALKMPDFRARERAFDLLEQVAGRAGRGENPGEVIIQTYLPDDPVIRAVAAHDRSIFSEHDLRVRAEALYPPFVRLVNIVCQGREEKSVRACADLVANALRRAISEESCGEPGHVPADTTHTLSPDPMSGPIVVGPASCVIERAHDRFRFHIVIKCPLGYHISRIIAATLSRIGSRSGISVTVDVDAYDLM
nr:primosomal protein N' [Coriobacterium glomerans]